MNERITRRAVTPLLVSLVQKLGGKRARAYSIMGQLLYSRDTWYRLIGYTASVDRSRYFFHSKNLENQFLARLVSSYKRVIRKINQVNAIHVSTYPMMEIRITRVDPARNNSNDERTFNSGSDRSMQCMARKQGLKLKMDIILASSSLRSSRRISRGSSNRSIIYKKKKSIVFATPDSHPLKYGNGFSRINRKRKVNFSLSRVIIPE